MVITNEEYEEYSKKSFFTDKNFSGRYEPKTINNNMIPYDKLDEFHYQTSFFLNLYASLYIELKKFQEENEYNITKFSNLINNLGININKDEIYNISKIENNNYTFYINKIITFTKNGRFTISKAITCWWRRSWRMVWWRWRRWWSCRKNKISIITRNLYY